MSHNTQAPIRAATTVNKFTPCGTVVPLAAPEGFAVALVVAADPVLVGTVAVPVDVKTAVTPEEFLQDDGTGAAAPEVNFTAAHCHVDSCQFG